MAVIKLCNLDDINDGDAHGIELVIGENKRSIICIRQGNQVLAYKNSCPHTGVNLEWQPNQFLDDTRQYLVCATHGALFKIEDGYCVSGPCAGDSLKKLEITQNDNEFFLNISQFEDTA